MSSYRRLAGACLHGSNSVPRVQEGLLKPSFGTLTLHSIVPEQVTGPVQTHGVKRETSSLSIKSCAQSLQSYSTLWNPMDCSPPGSSVHGILQAKISEGVAIPFSGGIFPTEGSNSHLSCLLHWQADSLLLGHLGSPPGNCKGLTV